MLIKYYVRFWAKYHIQYLPSISSVLLMPSTNLSYFVQACPVSSSVVPCHCISPSNAYIHSTQWVKYNQEIQMNSQSLGDTKSGTLLSRYTYHQPASAFQALYTFKQFGRHVGHLVHLHVGHLVNHLVGLLVDHHVGHNGLTPWHKLTP